MEVGRSWPPGGLYDKDPGRRSPAFRSLIRREQHAHRRPDPKPHVADADDVGTASGIILR
jgi:hypothetical protein